MVIHQRQSLCTNILSFLRCPADSLPGWCAGQLRWASTLLAFLLRVWMLTPEMAALGCWQWMPPACWLAHGEVQRGCSAQAGLAPYTCATGGMEWLLGPRLV